MEFVPAPTVRRVLCADCGTPIEPNSANLCIPCLRNSVDITEGIPKQATINFCRNCDRFLSPPQTWTIAEPESRQLLAICLKKLRGLSRVRLIDAGFIWTEPHSKRIQVKLTIQKEVFASTILQQVFQVEYVVLHGQCPDCTKLAAKNTWKALVQVRQKVNHKRTFLYLEQLILKHGADKDTVSVKEVKDGLDFFFAHRNHAIKMVDFLSAVVPIKSVASEQLLSSDTHTNTANFKYTYSVEIIPVCKDDLVCLPRKQAHSLSNIAPLVICSRIGNSVHLLDINTLQSVDMSPAVYWHAPFPALATVSDLIEFTVLDIESSGQTRGKYVLADAQIAPYNAFQASSKTQGADGNGMDVDQAGGTDSIYHTRTHLGGVLQPGDTVLGYFLSRSNFNSDDYELLDEGRIPDVILVKKTYPNRRKKSKAREWRLKSIAKEVDPDAPLESGAGRGALGRRGGLDQGKVERDYELFLRDLEEDPELRANVNLYKSKGGAEAQQQQGKKSGGKGKAVYAMDVEKTEAPAAAAADDDEEEGDFPEIKMDELLETFDELAIGDKVEEPQT